MSNGSLSKRSLLNRFPAWKPHRTLEKLPQTPQEISDSKRSAEFFFLHGGTVSSFPFNKLRVDIFQGGPLKSVKTKRNLNWGRGRPPLTCPHRLGLCIFEHHANDEIQHYSTYRTPPPPLLRDLQHYKVTYSWS